MLEAIKHIGERERSRATSELDTAAQDLAEKKNYSYMLLITFEVRAGLVTRYLETGLEEIGSSRKRQYLYGRGGGTSPDVTPTSLITEPERTIRTKLDGWIRKNADGSKDPFFSSLAVAYHDAHDRIVKDVVILYRARSGKKGYGLTLLFNDDGVRKYIGDYPHFQAFIMQKAAAPGTVWHEDHVCSICGNVRPIVYGDYGDVVPGGKTLKFYTLDKPGYIASGFSKENSWKNFPVCQDCAMDLEAGATYVKQHLNYALGGTQYYLIPRFIIGDKAILEHVLDAFRNYESTLASTSNDGLEKATNQEKFEATRKAEQDSERFAIRTIGDQSPGISFDLLFYDTLKGRAFKIMQHIQDVAPGRATLLVKAMSSVDKSPVFDSALPGGDDGRRSIQFSFWQLTQFFKKPDTPKDQTWKQEYLAIVANIFTGAPVGKDYILHQVMQKLRYELSDDVYNKQGKMFSFEEWTLRAFNTLLFLQGCHAVPANYGEVKDMGELADTTAQLFDENNAVSTPAKKAIFLTGVLTQRLLNIQWQKHGNTPFFKELKGLRLKEQDVKGLFPRIINKLEEYDKNYRAELEQETATQFARAGDHWDLTIDEINFIFSLGMTLANRINRKEADNATDKQN